MLQLQGLYDRLDAVKDPKSRTKYTPCIRGEPIKEPIKRAVKLEMQARMWMRIAISGKLWGDKEDPEDLIKKEEDVKAVKEEKMREEKKRGQGSGEGGRARKRSHSATVSGTFLTSQLYSALKPLINQYDVTLHSHYPIHPSMASTATRREPCYCTRCARNAQGFEYQTKRVIRDHRKKHSNSREKENLPQVKVHSGPETIQEEGVHELRDILGDVDVNVGGEFGSSADWDDWDDYNDTPLQAEDHANQIEVPGLPDQEDDSREDEDQEDELPPREDHLPAGRQDTAFEPARDPDVELPATSEDTYQRLAFEEKPEVQLAYLHAAMSNVYSGLSIVQAENGLNSQLDSLFIAGRLPEVPRPVCTLKSAKRRLGIDADSAIIQYSACPTCWKHHTPHEVEKLESPACKEPECNGVIYDKTRNKKGERKRAPRLLIPHTSIIDTLR
ncbi:hypothetical protein PM082_015266 [Marasmius tenuissimus]|nr:hypothetical protein PM082_015266 [Marasmius tenuissimus]